MFWLYFCALIPICIGLFIKLMNPNINWIEYIIGAFISLVVAGLFHIWAYYGQIGDYETWSGSITSARHYPAWREQYEEAIYRTETYTDSDGNTHTRQVFSHWETRRRWHKEYWKMNSNIDTEYRISKEKYQYLVSVFGGEKPIQGVRKTFETDSHMIAGDPNDYIAINKTGYIEPVNKSVFFENRLKSSSSIFKKRKINKEEIKGLFEYPAHNDPFISNRLLGEAQKIVKIKDWEKLNGYLGPIKLINVICIGYPAGVSSNKFDDQIAYWQGGKKNDFIIGYGEGWVRALRGI